MRAFHEVRNYDSNFKVWHTLYSNISFMAHWHKEIELIYVRKGTLEINITNLYLIAKEGDLIICDSGEIHYSSSPAVDNSVDFILFDTSIISTSYSTSNFITPLITKENLKNYGIEQKCRQFINTVIYELNHKELYYQDVIVSAIKEFWFLLKRQLPISTQSHLSSSKRLSTLGSFQQLLSYIENHYQDRISLQDSAAYMHFSTSHFSKIFKSLMGMSYVSYVNVVRIEHAVCLLKETSTVIDTAMNCGFNNIRTFNRVFKQVTGYTPSDFLHLQDIDAYSFAYYNHKSSEPHIVQNDSTMLIKYVRNESTLLQ